jgi:SAM-dependent methyltransferase
MLEVGAGIGGMIERLLERLEVGEVHYFALDSDPAHRAEAARRLQAWADGRTADWAATDDAHWTIVAPAGRVDIHWATASMFDDGIPAGPFDVVLAHAFLDLVDLDRALSRLMPQLGPGGLLYLTLNFDGLTAFLPEIEVSLDQAIVDAYHGTMDERRDGTAPSGDSRTGRRLLTELPRHGAEVLAAGASDWVIFPQGNAYPEGESQVLYRIIDLVEGALKGNTAVPADQLATWIARRRRQVRPVIRFAHQLDVLARRLD